MKKKKYSGGILFCFRKKNFGKRISVRGQDRKHPKPENKIKDKAVTSRKAGGIRQDC